MRMRNESGNVSANDLMAPNSGIVRTNNKSNRSAMQKIHRNSINRSPSDAYERAPQLPGMNPKPDAVNRMTKYQNRLDSRLSQPKLNSPARQSNQGSTTSLHRSIGYSPSPNNRENKGSRQQLYQSIESFGA